MPDPVQEDHDRPSGRARGMPTAYCVLSFRTVEEVCVVSFKMAKPGWVG
jgi:hypothetical protein